VSDETGWITSVFALGAVAGSLVSGTVLHLHNDDDGCARFTYASIRVIHRPNSCITLPSIAVCALCISEPVLQLAWFVVVSHSLNFFALYITLPITNNNRVVH
jgi:hypothetical protein